jgi:type VI secretion system secreted protein Hcp
VADCFIKLEGVNGESGDKEFQDHIQVESWGWGIASKAGHLGEHRRAGLADVAELAFTHRVDKASPALFARCASNHNIKNVTLVMRRAGGTAQKYLFVRLSDARIISVNLVHDAANVIPMERVVLDFKKVEYEYVPQSSAGSDRSGAVLFAYENVS